MDQWNIQRARNWHRFMPPARPSPAEVRLYERVAQSEALRDARDWILLGATPEIRSMAARMGRHLVCIDVNDEVFHALASMVEPRGPETFVHADWIDATIERPVSAVFADGSLNMLPAGQHDALLRRIHGMLRPQGQLVIRVHLQAPPRFETPEQVFEWYRASGTHEPVFSATRTHLDMLWLEGPSRTIDFAEYHRWIIKLRRKRLITADEFAAYDRLLEFNKIKLTYTTQEIFEKLLEPLFEIVAVHCGGDYSGHEQHPLYQLKRKDPSPDAEKR